METKSDMLVRYRSRIVLPALGMFRRSALKRGVRVEDYILPAKSRKKERASERVREILYEQS